MTIYVRYVGENGKSGLETGASYCIAVHEKTVHGISSVGSFSIQYTSIEEFLKEWSFIQSDFMSNLNE